MKKLLFLLVAVCAYALSASALEVTPQWKNTNSSYPFTYDDPTTKTSITELKFSFTDYTPTNCV